MNWGWEELEAYVLRTWQLYTITSRRCIDGFKYPPSQIWNADESGAQAGRNDGALVLASRGVRQVHIITPDEHLLVKSCINAVDECIPNISLRANNLDGTTSSLAKKEDLVRWVSWVLKKA